MAIEEKEAGLLINKKEIEETQITSQDLLSCIIKLLQK